MALIIIPQPLVSVLFERGRFSADDATATAAALAIYGLGLPAFVVQKVLQPLYFARADTRSPYRYALVAMAVNAVLAIGLAFWVGYLAAAIATSAAAWIMVWLLWRGSRAMGDAARLDARLRHRGSRIALAAAAMGFALIFAQGALAGYLYQPLVRYAALAALIAVGATAFFVTAWLLGAFRRGDLSQAMKRGE